MMYMKCHNLAKYYGKTEVFRGLNFQISDHAVVGIKGPNGSGKSTLLKCLAGLLRPSQGKVTWLFDEKKIEQRLIRYQIGFTAPYIQLYQDLTVHENLIFLSQVRPAYIESFTLSSKNNPEYLKTLFEIDTIASRTFGTLSSGQQQRVKLAAALTHSPPVLMLDEPGSNLDQDGFSLVKKMIARQQQLGGMVFLASNRQEELAFCTNVIELNPTP